MINAPLFLFEGRNNLNIFVICIPFEYPPLKVFIFTQLPPSLVKRFSEFPNSVGEDDEVAFHTMCTFRVTQCRHKNATTLKISADQGSSLDVGTKHKRCLAKMYYLLCTSKGAINSIPQISGSKSRISFSFLLGVYMQSIILREYRSPLKSKSVQVLNIKLVEC